MRRRRPRPAAHRGGGRYGRVAAVTCAAILLFPHDTTAQDLPGDGEGKWIVEAWCGACHSLTMVTQQGMSRRRWDETLVWMVEKQGMPELPDDAREIVLDYLAKHFGEGHRPGGAAGPPPSIGIGVQPLFPPG